MFHQGTLSSLRLSGYVKIIFNIFMPTLTNQYWYFTAYMGVFLCIPLLNMLVEYTPKNTLRNICIAIVFILYIGERLFSAVSFGFIDGYSFPWLALVYIIGGYIAKYQPFKNISVIKSMLYYFICIVATFLARVSLEIVIYLYKGVVVKNSFESLIIAHTAPTIVLAAIFLFNGFSKINIGNVGGKIIRFVAPLSFGVYLIHVNPIVFSRLSNVFIPFAEENTFAMVGLIFIASITIFIACIIIDYIRKLIFDLCRIKQLSTWIEKKGTQLFNKIFKQEGTVKSIQEDIPGNGIKNENTIFNR